MDSGTNSTIKIEHEVKGKFVDACCKHLKPNHGNSRKEIGDEGCMYGLGRRNGGEKKHFGEHFAISDDKARGFNKDFSYKYVAACKAFGHLMRRYFLSIVNSYKEKEREKGIEKLG